jgi:predicted dehydrogenase
LNKIKVEEKQMSKTKIGVIGIGALGKGMVKVFAEHPLVDLVAVCDADSAKVEQSSAHFNVEGFTHHSELLLE